MAFQEQDAQVSSAYLSTSIDQQLQVGSSEHLIDQLIEARV